jgi:enamine deaminase RidA (YjgF/YER057c/UK114 family)
MRRHFSSGSPYEPRIGVSRGVRAGNVIAIAGTAPIAPDGGSAAPGDAAGQARRCLEIINEALEGLGASLSHVIRTRILLTRMEDWGTVADVHREFFGDARPVTTVVQVSAFADPAWLVEIEADAVVE